jgi:CHAT domain-containing protein/predicted negative regulator of RcsB-dependent stress response
METEILMEQVLSVDLAVEELSTPLPDTLANALIEQLKREADRHWFMDAERSLAFANRIIAIGDARNDISQSALGWMARGDALRWLGRMQEAWETLEQAGNMFRSVGNQVGWARTRVGRLYLAMKLDHVRQTLDDGKEAEKILKHSSAWEFLVRLNMARAVVYGSLGNLRRTLRLLLPTLTVAQTLELSDQLGILYMNIGLANEGLGDFSLALMYYEQARQMFVARNETRNIALIELNIAYIAQAQGHYHRALDLLHGILERNIEQFPMEHLAVKRDMTECYLQLNRFSDASQLAQEITDGYRSRHAAYETARSLLILATAKAELGKYSAAQTALEEAQRIFTSLGAMTWLAITRLRRGRIAIQQGDAEIALQEATASAASFESEGQQVHYGMATVMKGQALFSLGHLSAASEAGKTALHIAQRYQIPSLRYIAHRLMGQIAESREATTRAIRHYQAAATTIERVQRRLTITLRPGFLEDKGEASRALMSLYLRNGQSKNAFETLERTKSQVLLGYLANRESLRWTTKDPRSRALIEELNHLRAEHQWFYGLAHDSARNTKHPSVISPEQALAEVANRERRMRTITEQLYIHSDQQENQVRLTSLDEIRSTLDERTLLVEFYNDGAQLWAFVLDRQTLVVHPLPATVGLLNQLLAQLQTNIDAALAAGTQSPAIKSLTLLTQRILKRLYVLLIEPLQLQEHNAQRLLIVPYGALHYLPFHLLHDGSRYLIEKYELVILPAAGLACQPAQQRQPGANILAHSFDDRLPQTLTEARMVQEIFGGRLCVEEQADRAALQTPPTQVLHIAAHGRHRLDQPELSYLQLADGQLFADDILQQDLSYELVTLSACETGRANVAASDELIGLGRSFLYAGAGALLVSLWRVEDVSALTLMERVYRALFAGASKAAALRDAQRSLLMENREAHPAFWGAFQLIGNADPFSTLNQ